MNITVHPRKLHGKVNVIPSKSLAHRVLICSAFADKDTEIICPMIGQDLEATIQCLILLGATIVQTDVGFRVYPIKQLPEKVELNCYESGSTLRFFLPIVGALGIDTTFQLSERLAQRPLSPLWEEMERMGCSLKRTGDHTIHCCGRLQSGEYYIDGSVSSQFITGLLFATSLMQDDSQLVITESIESLPYIEMTQHILSQFGINTTNYKVSGNQNYISPGIIHIDGDWSNGAYFLAANVLGSQIEITNLDAASCQGDRVFLDLIPRLSQNATISVAHIPDLLPILSVIAAVTQGATFINTNRLRYKESDRIDSTVSLLRSLGICTDVTEDTLTVYPGHILSGHVDSYSDHRIAMTAAIASTVASGTITISNAHCVAKSYPNFWDEFKLLGGYYE